jgi:hypothetical protein
MTEKKAPEAPKTPTRWSRIGHLLSEIGKETTGVVKDFTNDPKVRQKATAAKEGLKKGFDAVKTGIAKSVDAIKEKTQSICAATQKKEEAVVTPPVEPVKEAPKKKKAHKAKN